MHLKTQNHQTLQYRTEKQQSLWSCNTLHSFSTTHLHGRGQKFAVKVFLFIPLCTLSFFPTNLE